MADSSDELEPLFDYSRVQPVNIVFVDDDDSPIACPKRKKISEPVEKGDETVKVIEIVNSKEAEEDWLLPPPKVSVDAHNELGENSTIKELRLRKQELLSYAKSAEHALEEVESSVTGELDRSLQPSLDAVAVEPPKYSHERAKVVISVQGKDGQKQFRVYMDDKFERLFKLYADRVKLDPESLVFCFDGSKISAHATPDSLGMEDDDIIEVHVKKS
ncbi:uncharacterized protein LOC110813473 isoform X2 [Carica papaya]|uniref:uncharacterized protein LOC110813473 isoform X2 n=1 Tax=Carica papaya TaxID=3649 RepID=UPI000B8D0B40|nr:uncharacterized protein LOC110813473 isoform X2 [Carica papaya]